MKYRIVNPADVPACGGDLELAANHVLWAMRGRELERVLGQAARLDLNTIKPLAPSPARLFVQGGVAMLRLHGILLKRRSAVLDAVGGTGMDEVTRLLDEALRRRDVRAVLLSVASSGASVWGSDHLADAIAKAGIRKTTVAHIDGPCIAGAYLAIAGATRIYAAPLARVGAIGRYSTTAGDGGEAPGLRVELVRPPSQGWYDTELDALRMCSCVNDHFRAHVSACRGLDADELADVADRAFSAEGAERAGLVDAVKTFNETLAELSRIER